MFWEGHRAAAVDRGSQADRKSCRCLWFANSVRPRTEITRMPY